jgi:hypothetical protein
MQIAAIELYHVSVPLKQTIWPTSIPDIRKRTIDSLS